MTEAVRQAASTWAWIISRDGRNEKAHVRVLPDHFHRWIILSLKNHFQAIGLI